MQLNNKITGQIIIIDYIDFLSNSVFYSVYEFGGDNKVLQSNEMFTFETFKIIDLLDTLCNVKEQCYNKLIEQKYTDFELSLNEDKNWLIETRPIRLLIPLEFANNHLKIDDNLGKIINRERKLNAQSINKFLFTIKSHIVAYFNMISPDIDPETNKTDEEVLYPFIRTPQNPTGEIIIETLN